MKFIQYYSILFKQILIQYHSIVSLGVTRHLFTLRIVTLALGHTAPLHAAPRRDVDPPRGLRPDQRGGRESGAGEEAEAGGRPGDLGRRSGPVYKAERVAPGDRGDSRGRRGGGSVKIQLKIKSKM